MHCVTGGGFGSEIRLSGPSGATVIIGDSVAPFRDGYDFVDFTVAIEADGLSARTSVRSLEDGGPTSLHGFVRELAEDWKGERSHRKWEAIGHDLTIDADRDSLGHVRLTFSLRESYLPDSWRARATVQLDAGEEMSLLAREVERLLAG